MPVVIILACPKPGKFCNITYYIPAISAKLTELLKKFDKLIVVIDASLAGIKIL